MKYHQSSTQRFLSEYITHSNVKLCLMCNLVSSDDDGEHKQTFSIAVIHQYLQMTSIVSPPCGVIQAVVQPLSQPYTQQWKSIIFHKITNDVVLLLCCISQVEFNQQLCVFHYTLAITLFLLVVLTVSLACVKLLGKKSLGHIFTGACF